MSPLLPAGGRRGVRLLIPGWKTETRVCAGGAASAPRPSRQGEEEARLAAEESKGIIGGQASRGCVGGT